MVQQHLDRLEITQAAVARATGIDPGELNRKIHGKRRWYMNEGALVLAFLKQHDASLSMEALFGLEPLPPTPDLHQLDQEASDADEEHAEVVGAATGVDGHDGSEVAR